MTNKIVLTSKYSNFLGPPLINSLDFWLDFNSLPSVGYPGWWAVVNGKYVNTGGFYPVPKVIELSLDQGINNLEIIYGNIGYTTGKPYGSSTFASIVFEFDSIAPTLNSINDYSKTKFFVNSIIKLIFNEPIKLNSNERTLYNLTQKRYVSDAYGMPSLISIQEGVLDINFDKYIENNSEYLFRAEPGFISDIAGNKYNTAIEIQFSTRDTLAPLITKLSPEQGSKNNILTTNIQIEFNEKITFGDGNITLEKEDGSIVEKFSKELILIDKAGLGFTIDPSADLIKNKRYRLVIDDNALSDLQGNYYKSVNEIIISTEDTISPKIIDFPSAKSQGADPKPNLIFDFDEEIFAGIYDILIKNDDAEIVEKFTNENLNISISGTRVEIKPSIMLETGSRYSIEFENGSFVDAAGNYSSKRDFTFYTSGIGPVTTNLIPISSSTETGGENAGIDFSVKVTFNKNISKSYGNIRIISQDGEYLETYAWNSPNLIIKDNFVEIKPTNLVYDKIKYNIIFEESALTDRYGNKNYYLNNYSFTTADKTPPQPLTTTKPNELYLNIKPGENISIRFTEFIAPGNTVIEILDDANSIIETYEANDNRISFSREYLLINLPASLNYNSSYKLKINPNSIFDLSGNKYDKEFIGELKTSEPPDTTPPKILLLSPENNTTISDLTANLVITFDEAVKIGDGTIYIKHISGKIFESYNNSTNGATVLLNKLTINPRAQLADASTYIVEISPGAILDQSGNPYVGENTLIFTTVDKTAPYIQFRSGSKSINSSILFKMSESIKYGSGTASLKENSTTIEVFYPNTPHFPFKKNSFIYGDTLIINPTNNLKPNTNYSIELGDNFVQDFTGNPFDKRSEAFTSHNISDNLPPILRVGYPTKTISKLALPTADFEFKFDEYISLGLGKIELIKSNGEIIEVFDKTSSQIDVLALDLTISPTKNLESNTVYKFSFPAGFITDLAGNSIDQPFEFKFATEGKVASKAFFWNDQNKNTSLSGLDSAIDLGDAIAILKMIVGLNINANGAPVSPYQSIAADFNQNGDIDLDDAIGVLKKIVGLSSPEPVWKYFDESKVKTTISLSESMSPKVWIDDAVISDLLSTSPTVNIVGILTGDVNGSWI